MSPEATPAVSGMTINKDGLKKFLSDTPKAYVKEMKDPDSDVNVEVVVLPVPGGKGYAIVDCQDYVRAGTLAHAAFCAGL